MLTSVELINSCVYSLSVCKDFFIRLFELCLASGTGHQRGTYSPTDGWGSRHLDPVIRELSTGKVHFSCTQGWFSSECKNVIVDYWLVLKKKILIILQILLLTFFPWEYLWNLLLCLYQVCPKVHLGKCFTLFYVKSDLEKLGYIELCIFALHEVRY